MVRLLLIMNLSRIRAFVMILNMFKKEKHEWENMDYGHKQWYWKYFYMSLRKLLKLITPKFIKTYIKRKMRFPQYNYGVVYSDAYLRKIHSESFSKFHEKFSIKDNHLNSNINVTRLRNYYNYTFSKLAIEINPNGSFLSAGISFGTSLKVITHLLDETASGNPYYLIDPFKNIDPFSNNTQEMNYNINPQLIKDDLKNIKNFSFIFIKEYLASDSLKKIQNDLTFSHLNTGDFEAERNNLNLIINKTLKSGVIILDYYGWYNENKQLKIDNLLSARKDVTTIFLPTLQLVIIKR